MAAPSEAQQPDDHGLPTDDSASAPPLTLVAPPAPREALSPFLDHPDDGHLPPALLLRDARPGIVVDLLRDPVAVGQRILDDERLPHLVVVAALLVAGCGAFFALVTLAPWASSDEIWRSARR